MTISALTWAQVSAWRVQQQGLAPRLPHAGLLQAATRTGGIQAQVLSAAELAIAARVDGLTRDEIQAALWRDRTLVKTWAMRGTLHLIAASEIPLYAAARSLFETRSWDSYFAYYGISPAEQQAYLAAVPHVLGDVPITREQLATAVAKHTGIASLRALILSSGWGSPLKPSAFRGDLCFGPSQGQNVTFVRPSAWAGSWQPADPEAAAQEIARRYLRTYGPSTPEDFVRWWVGGAGLIAAKRLFQSIQDEIEVVDVEGWRALALRETVPQIGSLAPSETVLLLPLFDAYTLGLGRGPDIEPLLPSAYQHLVYRPQGWISAVVLVDGYPRGVWEYARKRAQTAITIRLFSPPTTAVRRGIDAEGERLGAFLNTEIALEYADTR